MTRPTPVQPVRLVACLLLTAACTGPALHVQNPDEHRVFVDGVATSEPMLPFRYYGVSRWDALPVDTQANGRPSWALQSGSGAIELPPPASPWLFPLDLPLELARRIVFGREDVTATIVLPPTPADQRIDAEVAPTGQSGLVDRAQKARTSR